MDRNGMDIYTHSRYDKGMILEYFASGMYMLIM